MKLGVFAKTFTGSDPDSVLGSAAAAGFETAHYNMVCSGLAALPDAIPPNVTSAIASAADRHELSICGVSATFNMVHPDPAVRRIGLARLDVIAGSASAIGTNLITLCTGTRDADDQWRHHPDNDTPEAWHDLCAAMAEAVTIAEAHGLLLGIEPELGNVVSSASLARRMIEDLQSDRLRIVLDPANLFDVRAPDQQRRIVSEAVDQLADLIVVAHAKDRAPDGSATTAGAGLVDFDHYLTELRRIGFDGPLVAHGLAAGEAQAAVRFLRARLGSRRTDRLSP